MHLRVSWKGSDMKDGSNDCDDGRLDVLEQLALGNAFARSSAPMAGVTKVRCGNRELVGDTNWAGGALPTRENILEDHIR